METRELHTTSPDSWLLSIGIISEQAEQNLMLYAYLSTPGVLFAEFVVDIEKRNIQYVLVLSRKSRMLLAIQEFLFARRNLLSKLILAFILKLFGSYNPKVRIVRCLRDYIGSDWTVQVEVVNVKQYNKVTNNNHAKSWFFKERDAENRTVY
jgi:hypothetical protein